MPPIHAQPAGGVSAAGVTQPQRGRVLVIAAYDVARPSTGTAARGQQLLEGLAPRHDLHLVYLDSARPAGQPVVPPRLPEGLASVARAPYSAAGYFLFSPTLYRLAAETLERHRCNLIVADFENAGLYGLLLARRYGVPLIYNSHDVEYRRYLGLAQRDWRRGVLTPYIYAVERLTARASRRVVTISPDDAEVFARWVGSDRVVVIPGSFDETQYHPFYPQPPAEPPTVLFVGNMNYLPNREAARLLQDRVIPAVRARRPEVRFQLVGVHPPELDDAAAGVEFPGFVEDLVPWLRGAHVVVAPLLRGGGMRIKTIEALACGKPVVATPLGVQGIDWRPLDGVTVTAPEHLAEAILTSLEQDPPVDADRFAALRDTYGRMAVVDQFDRVLQEVLTEAVSR